jgi:hypothetical protein
MTGIFYLPEYHDFEHIAVAPWPKLAELQLDWVDAMNQLETWLNRYVGPHYAEWAYAQQQTYDYWQACIAFKRAQSKTLFLLTWA